MFQLTFSGFVDHVHDVLALQNVAQHVLQNANGAVLVLAPAAYHLVAGVAVRIRSNAGGDGVVQTELTDQPAPIRPAGAAAVVAQALSDFPQVVVAQFVDVTALAGLGERLRTRNRRVSRHIPYTAVVSTATPRMDLNKTTLVVGALPLMTTTKHGVDIGLPTHIGLILYANLALRPRYALPALCGPRRPSCGLRVERTDTLRFLAGLS